MFILLGNGLELNGNTFALNVNDNVADNDNDFINLSENGFALSGISNAINDADVAVSGLIMTEVNKKQDKLTIVSSDITTANNNSIPTTQAVSAFVDKNKLQYKEETTSISFENNTYTTVTTSLNSPAINLNATVKNSICRFTFTGTPDLNITGIVYTNSPLSDLVNTPGTYLMSLDNGVCIWVALEEAKTTA